MLFIGAWDTRWNRAKSFFHPGYEITTYEVILRIGRQARVVDKKYGVQNSRGASVE